MNIISFTYTKSNGTATNRTISPVVVPNKMYEGIDLSELSDEDQVFYCQELGFLKDEYHKALAALQTKFDVENRYRRFDPTKMSNIVQEAV